MLAVLDPSSGSGEEEDDGGLGKWSSTACCVLSGGVVEEEEGIDPCKGISRASALPHTVDSEDVSVQYVVEVLRHAKGFAHLEAGSYRVDRAIREREGLQ